MVSGAKELRYSAQFKLMKYAMLLDILYLIKCIIFELNMALLVLKRQGLLMQQTMFHVTIAMGFYFFYLYVPLQIHAMF